MKKIIALLLVLVMALSLVACGNKADEKVSLNVIAAQYGGKTADWWVGFEKDFEAANENIDLVVDVVSWNDIYTVVNTRISNNDAPDILNIDVFADYQADGLLLPAQDFVSEETYAKFYPAFLEQSVVDGTVWAVPDLASARALYYNADILAAAGVEVPTTWAELKAACEAIKAYDANIYPWGVDMTTDEGQACFAYYAWTNGGGFVDAEGNWTLNSAENVEAANYVLDLVASGLTNTSPATETRYDLQEMFAAGKLAMMIGPNQISSYVAGTENPINFGIASIPANEGKATSSVGVMDRFMCFDNDYSDAEMEAIKKFFDFFYEDKRYSDWVIMEDFLPATSAGGAIMAEADPAAAAWIDIVGSAQFYPAAKAEWADVKQGVINVLQQGLLGQDVQGLLDALQAEIAG
jgi:multiple sugar transport system substrate-binding protein